MPTKEYLKKKLPTARCVSHPGRPAVAYRTSAWICAECLAIEKANERRETCGMTALQERAAIRLTATKLAFERAYPQFWADRGLKTPKNSFNGNTTQE